MTQLILLQASKASEQLSLRGSSRKQTSTNCVQHFGLRPSWEKENSLSKSIITPYFAVKLWLTYLICHILHFSITMLVKIESFLLPFLSLCCALHSVTLTPVTSINGLLSASCACAHASLTFNIAVSLHFFSVISSCLSITSP